MHQTLFVFDIETVPDTNAARALTGVDTTDVDELRQALTDYHLEVTDGRNSFLRQPFHKVVAISFLEAEIHRDGPTETYHLRDLRSGGRFEAPEAELLAGFFQYIDRHKPRLVSFNGRTFDLPVLKYRAMVHGVQANWLHTGGDKWNNYNSRYSADWHCDLLEVLSDFGASSRIKLNEVCSVLGLPGKFGVDGSQVTPLFDEGKLDTIRNYCETDVLNTYLLYLRVMHHQGRLATRDHDAAVAEVITFIEGHAKDRPYLLDFMNAWHAACHGKFLLADIKAA
jgi:predicted PolB exonuclease-like 3'-5' exonuclease